MKCVLFRVNYKVYAQDFFEVLMFDLYKDFANSIRVLSVDMIEQAGSGHQGVVLGLSDVVSVLFCDKYNFEEDRFVLSNGHASAMLYSALYLTGSYDISLDDLKNFRKFNAKLQGHPERNLSLGIDITTGALGQGLASSVGLAIALKKKKTNAKVFVMCGDGDLMEGISHEVMTLASSLNLNNLIVLFDNNDICIDGNSSLYTTDNVSRFKSYGFEVIEADGHDYKEISDALDMAMRSKRPSFVSFKTVIGRFSALEGKNVCHGKFLSKDEISNIKTSLGFEDKPFSVDLNKFVGLKKGKFHRINEKFYANEIDHVMNDLKKYYLNFDKKDSTRNIFGNVIKEISPKIRSLIGGSADLSESTCCLSENMRSINKEDFSGNYIHYGVREHAMGAIMSGLSAEGFIPYGGTFLVFSDYMKPAIRNSAIMKLGNIFVFSHDSIAVGEDGATHQPIEHIDALRAIPGLNVFRPSSGMEVVECVEIALKNRHTPSAIILSRQNIDPYARRFSNINQSEFGMYEVYKSNSCVDKTISFIATGSEVALAFKVINNICDNKYNIRLISAPCLELFENQPKEYKNNIINEKDNLRVFIEAGACQSFYKYKREKDLLFNIQEFGTSGSCQELMQHFGFTFENLTMEIKNKLRDPNFD